jgi:hypothetical protein
MAKLKDGSRIYGDATVDKTLTVGNVTISGNLVVTGTTTSVNSTVTQLQDPIFELGGGANGGALTNNDGQERGILMHYYDGAVKDAFMGWHTSNAQFEFGSVATETSGNVAIGTHGNLKAGVFFGDAGGLSNIVGANVTGDVFYANYANFAGTVTGNAQSNITSVGNLTGLQIGNATTTGNVVINTNGNIAATGKISGLGSLYIGNSLSPTAEANIYGDLNVTGNVSGRFTGSVAAKGANTNIQFNDDGNQNATSGFTFTKTSNTVGIDNVSIAGTDGNISVTGVGRFIGSTGVNVKATSGSLNLTADGKDLTIDNTGVSYNSNFNVDSTGNITADGYLDVASNIWAAGGDFTVTATGNVSAKRGDFTSIKDTGLTDTQLVFTTGNVLGGSSTLTYASGLLKAGNVETSDANITGNITTKFSTTLSGKLLTTDNAGNLITSSVSFSNELLTVGNANVTSTTTTANLKVTGLASTSVPIVGTAGSITESANLTFSSNKLNTSDIKATGDIEGGTVTVNNLVQTQVVFADANGKLISDADMTFDGNKLTVANLTSGGHVRGNTVQSDNLIATRVVFANTGGNLTSDEFFTFTGGNLTANTIKAPVGIESVSIKANNLSTGSVVVADAGGALSQATGFSYSGTTLSAPNVSVSANITASNVYANSGIIGAQYLKGDGSNISGVTATSIAAANVTGTTLSSNVTTASITTLSSAMNNITMGSANSISGGNLLSASYLTGTLTTASQPNVTSVGTLTGLTVDGNISITGSGNGIKTDNLFYANGTAWDLQQAAGSNNYIQYNSDNNFAANSNFTFDPAAVSSTGKLTVTGQVDTGLVTATTGNITTVNSTNIFATTGNITTVNATTGNITTVVATTGNITTVNVTDIEASGNANINGWLKAKDTVITGNLTVTGTTTSVNTTTSQLTDPLLDLGNGANGAALTTNDAFDRGLLMHTRTGGTNNDLFMGWDNSNSEFVLAKSVSVTDNVVTLNGANATLQAANLADLRLSNIYAYNANFGGVVFSEGNITLGSGSYLNGNLNGNVSGSFTVTGGAGAIQFANASNVLTSNANINFDESNVALTVGNGSTTGKVIANLVTGTLTTASQPNVTSVGTLGNLNVATTLNVASSAFIANSGGIYTDGYYYANGSAIDFQTAAGSATQIQFKSSSGNDLAASANLTFDTSTSNLTVNGNIITGTGSGGNISGANVVSATLFVGSGANLTNINGANVSEVATATNVTGSSQSNITSVGTLTSLTVTNDITSTSGKVLAGQIGNSATYLYGDGSNVSGITASYINAANLTGSTLSSNVTSSSLTSVGSLNGLTIAANSNITMSGSASRLSGGNLVSATYLTGTLTTANQGNITTVGTLGSLTVTNDITSTTGKVLAGQIGNSATYLYGDGANIASVTGANVTGEVSYANVANAVAAGNLTGTTINSSVVTSSLTSVGTLGSLTVTNDITVTTGNIVAGNIGNPNTTLYGNGYNITDVTASSMDAGNLTGTTINSSVVTSSLTSVGTLSGLTATSTIDFTGASNVALGAVANVHITGGSSGQYLQTNGSGTLSFTTVELANIHNGTSNVAVAASGNVTAVVAGSNIITIATTGLTVTGVIEATGNITAANLISNAKIIASGTTDASSAITGTITTAGGISAEGNIYTGNVVGFAHGGGNTASAAYIKYNSTGAGSIDFIFN